MQCLGHTMDRPAWARGGRILLPAMEVVSYVVCHNFGDCTVCSSTYILSMSGNGTPPHRHPHHHPLTPNPTPTVSTPCSGSSGRDRNNPRLQAWRCDIADYSHAFWGVVPLCSWGPATSMCGPASPAPEAPVD